MVVHLFNLLLSNEEDQFYQKVIEKAMTHDNGMYGEKVVTVYTIRCLWERAFRSNLSDTELYRKHLQ